MYYTQIGIIKIPIFIRYKYNIYILNKVMALGLLMLPRRTTQINKPQIHRISFPVVGQTGPNDSLKNISY